MATGHKNLWTGISSSKWDTIKLGFIEEAPYWARHACLVKKAQDYIRHTFYISKCAVTRLQKMSGDREDSQIATGQETRVLPNLEATTSWRERDGLIFIISQLLNTIKMVRSAQSQTGDSVLNLKHCKPASFISTVIFKNFKFFNSGNLNLAE